MLWFDGIQTWTKAANIPELKDVFGSIPPPFERQASPLVDTHKKEAPKAEPVSISTAESKKKNSLGKNILLIAAVLLLIIGGLVIMNVMENPNDNSFMNVTINPPNPRVVESHGKEDRSSKMFSYKEGIDCTILNQGGSGNVLVTCILIQNDHSYERSKEIFMAENATEELHFVFDEAKLLGGDMTHRIEVKATQ